VGNKLDLSEHVWLFRRCFLLVLCPLTPSIQQRCVSADEGKKVAAKENMFFIETSAKDATNIEKAFTHLIKGRAAGWLVTIRWLWCLCLISLQKL